MAPGPIMQSQCDRKKRMKKEGFTMIELLIVIAIIAVITAIAVPNLISANIKATVRGIKSEMGSIAIALEDYRLDEGNYPIDPGHTGSGYGADVIAGPGDFDDYEDAIGLGKLIFPGEGASDPVYLYRIPGDPYNNSGEEEWNGTSGAHNNHYCYFTADASGSASYTEAKYWALVSYGPDKDLDITSYSDAKDAYDNGTDLYDPDSGITSNGDIVIIGP